MKFCGERRIEAAPGEVFAALNDAEVLRRCIPGCVSLEKKSESEMSAKVRLKIGPVSALFSGTVSLCDIDAPRGYTLRGSGEGGAAGGAQGEAKVSLQEQNGGTLLQYEASAQVSGKLAQLGARLMEGAAKSLANKFFDNFAAEWNPPQTQAGEGVAAAGDSAKKKKKRKRKKRTKKQKWMVSVLTAAAAVLLFFLLFVSR